MSIRTYIFALLTGLILILSVIFSYQSASFFLGSFEMAIEEMMLDVGRQYPEEGKVEQTILEFHATTDWQKVPKPVRQHFPVIPTETEELHSKFVNWVYFAPPEKAYSLMVINRDGMQVFVSRFNEHIHQEIANEHINDPFIIDPMIIILLVGLGGISLFVIVLLFIFKKIASPVESLQQWAKQMKLSDLEAERPDFRFKELNSLAKLIQENFVSVANAIEREQEFLKYASHELRTPIAVIRSNSALLEKVNPLPSNKEREVRERIQRASLTMKSMTETLLWLSREGETEISEELTGLGDLVKNTQVELTYLLAGKSVEVELKNDNEKLSIAIIPCIIVLNNLIRNAFQHTQQGSVKIVQCSAKVTVTNVEFLSDAIDQNKNELGFGLGMQLVKKLTEQFGWQYTAENIYHGYQVSVIFTSVAD